MKEYIMMVGAPCSGKSTYIDQFLENSDKKWFVVSSDNIIMEWANKEGLSYSDGFNKFAKKAMSEMNRRFKEAIKNGDNIIHDQTNMTVNSRRKKLCQVPKGYERTVVAFEIDYGALMERSEQRKVETGKYVPVKVVDNMLEMYVRPIKSEGFKKVTIIKS